ncbi:hypothetical protein [Flavobacterium sp.]|uniref:hypothetical protein n=1 Tax=Flavobacterium sp. TaxID=239 RepID=UPI00261F2A87|nr:hypothetical protein [Flavobacterium sp.]MDD2984968.1 hypothetical protein [Flavobacterium sp.]
MKKGVILVFLMCVFSAFSQEKQAVYLIFNQDASATCDFPVRRDPVKKIKLTYTQKRHRKVNITRFIFCRNIFVFELMKNKFETVDASALSSYKIVTMQDLLAKEEEMEFKKDINALFPEIYLLESIENNQYAKYEIVWEKVQ